MKLKKNKIIHINIFQTILQIRTVIQKFTEPTDQEKAVSIVSSLKHGKSSGPNSIYYQKVKFEAIGRFI